MADKKKNKNDKTKNFLNIAGIRKIYKPKPKKGNNYSYEIIKKNRRRFIWSSIFN